jgi:hypothetical protein
MKNGETYPHGIVLSLILSLAFFIVSGCTIPVTTKTEMRSRQTASFVKDANYLVLARYWDDNAEKQTIDFHSAPFLTVREEEGRAEITIGNGPYYGMIELKKIDDKSTLITSYAWGSVAGRIFEWEAMLRQFSPDQR